MADLEVEKTLREIRERVLSDAQRRAPVAAMATGSAEVSVANGHDGPATEALARMDANLATTTRAWSRLPPLLSYRRGAAARFEIWVKQLVKRATHWFTWEQVNFNAAVHHTLGDVRAVLAAQEQALAAHGKTLARVQDEILTALRAEAEADRARVAELQSRLAEAQARFESGGAQLRQAFATGLERLSESQRASIAALREELGTRAESLHAETNARTAELHAEMRERVDGLLEEQRVCFKQLSLEAGEAAVTHDRARRQLEARLEALEGKK
ncbi:MAG: hypothetical protein ACJ74T_14705 [Pyrinomonadaceae bacterium]